MMGGVKMTAINEDFLYEIKSNHSNAYLLDALKSYSEKT